MLVLGYSIFFMFIVQHFRDGQSCIFLTVYLNKENMKIFLDGWTCRTRTASQLKHLELQSKELARGKRGTMAHWKEGGSKSNCHVFTVALIVQK